MITCPLCQRPVPNLAAHFNMKPKRIQLSRKRGWRMPPNAVNVARPTYFGNPWKVGVHGTATQCVATFRSELPPGTFKPLTNITTEMVLMVRN